VKTPVTSVKDDAKTLLEIELGKKEKYIKGLQTQIENLKKKLEEAENKEPVGYDIDVKALCRHIATLRIAHARLPRGASRAFMLLKQIMKLETLKDAKDFYEENRNA
jgi:hypothetical protein